MCINVGNLEVYDVKLENTAHVFFSFLDWDTSEISNDEELDTVTRCLLSALLKHCNLVKVALYRRK